MHTQCFPESPGGMLPYSLLYHVCEAGDFFPVSMLHNAAVLFVLVCCCQSQRAVKMITSRQPEMFKGAMTFPQSVPQFSNPFRQEEDTL